jgi:lactate permease
MGDLPLTFGLWIAAIAPLLFILVLLVGLQWKAGEAGGAGFFLTAAIALLLFEIGFEPLTAAIGKGIWDAVFILYVVWPALLLYHFTRGAGAFEVFRQGAQRYTKSNLMLVLAFGWVFASFLQGIAGFGAPIAIVAPLLVGIGVRPKMAVIVPLIGHAWANLFGTLAVAWLVVGRVVDLQDPSGTALQAAALLIIPNILAGLAISWLYGRGKALVHALPVVLVIGVVHAGGQLVLAPINPVLANFVPVTLALGVIYGLARIKRYSEDDGIDSSIMESTEAKEDEESDQMSLLKAITPYVVLIVLAVSVLTVPAVNDTLEQYEIGFAFPEVTTGQGVTQEAEEMYGEFPVLTHPGTFLLVAAIFAIVFYRSIGRLDTDGIRESLKGTVSDGVPASIAIVAFLALSQIMEHAGMTPLLAAGVAAVSPPLVYAFFANMIGMIGSFMTSSNTASNILFAPFQQETAAAAGLPETAIVAAQSAGAATGNAIAPANVVLGTTTARAQGQEGAVLRYTLVWAGAVAIFMGVATVVFVVLTG